MATIRRQCDVAASPEAAWDAVRDVGAVHTRLAPGFVADTRLEQGARVVTFVNGMVVREPIVTVDDDARRLVWSAEGGLTTHYNAALEVLPGRDGGATIVWTADFLPDDVQPRLAAAIEAGMRAIKAGLDRLAQ
ncbi:MAG: SRPBCC family protein [Hyphomicrobiales bacterium]|nr:SRPBCC family protein [Hyphomicrobiales bacterium]